jgi:hypothetical protein
MRRIVDASHVHRHAFTDAMPAQRHYIGAEIGHLSGAITKYAMK